MTPKWLTVEFLLLLLLAFILGAIIALPLIALLLKPDPNIVWGSLVGLIGTMTTVIVPALITLTARRKNGDSHS